jgi:glycosyltransferase involved in cell wall biosynthesis
VITNKRVSLIIPVYQAEKYLWHCAESVMSQSYKNIEIILVDDGSTDKSPDICDNLARMDERVKVIHQKNGGISSARNTGLRNASGEYISFLDSDDFLHRHFVKYLLFLCIKYEAQLAAGSLYSGNGGDFEGISMRGNTSVYSGKEAILSRRVKSGVVGKLYKKELFDGLVFPVSDHFNYEDEAVIYKLLDRSKQVVITKKPLYYYFQNPISTTRKENHYKPTDFYEVLQERVLYFLDKDRELFEYAYEYLCLNLMLFYFTCKRDEENTNDLEELLRRYENAYFKVLYNEVTPLKYKLMFTAFYQFPEPCALIANKAGLPLKKQYEIFKRKEKRLR